MIKYKKPRPVWVVWDDHSGYSAEWVDDDYLKEYAKKGSKHVVCNTIGFLWGETPTEWIVTSTITNIGGCGAPAHILKSAGQLFYIELEEDDETA